MSKTSRPTLAARLNEKTAQEQRERVAYDQRIEAEIEAQVDERLRALGEKLTRLFEHELTRTTSAIHRSLGALWLRSLAITLGVCLATWSSLWAIGQWQHRQIRENIDIMLLLDQQIEERRQTLRELNQE